MSGKTIDETPWEVSVFAALLKMRWAHHGNVAGYQPDLVDALDDAAETALGDVLLRENDRLFLFELKASWERATTESEKPIFGRYEELHSLAQQQHSPTEFNELLLWSIRCHHLVYWEDLVALSDDSVRGTISFSPYALFVLDRLSSAGAVNTDFRHFHALAQSRVGGNSMVEAASIVSLFDKSAKATSGNLLSGKDVEFSELGLEQAAFSQFVQRLRGKADNGDIRLKLIAFSPVSGFVRRISSLDDAVQLGLDWAEGTASSKPAGPRLDQRTGKPRVVGGKTLICSAPIATPANGQKATGGGKFRNRKP